MSEKEIEKKADAIVHHVTPKDLFWWGLTGLSILISVVLIVQSFYSSRENDRTNHRLDIGDAYFYKALIDRSKKLEEGYYAERRQNEKIREHCKSNPCKLSNDLSVALSEIQIEPLDKILTNKTKEKTE